MEKIEAKEEADVGGLHGLDLAGDAHEVAAGERGAVAIDDALHIARDGAEVAILHVGVDVEGAAGVVVADDGRLAGARDVGDVGQDLGQLGGGRGDGNVLDVAQGLDLVLRRLRDDAVENVVLVVEEVLGLKLGGAGEDVDGGAADVALGVAALEGLGAVDGDLEDGRVVGLLETEIDEAGDLGELLHHGGDDGAVAGVVVAFDLDVDGSGKAEVEDLGDDVGGKEVEGDAGELAGQAFAEGADVVGGGRVILLEGDHDVGVGGTEETAGGVLGVHGGVGKADVVEDVVHLAGRDGLADGLLDEIAEPSGLLDAGSGLGADVQDEGAVVGGGEEVLAEERDQEQRDQAGEQEERDEELAGFDQLGEKRFVGGADAFEAALEAALEAGEDVLREGCVVVYGLEQIHGHGGHQRSGQDVGGKHGEDDGFGEGHEEIAGNAGEEEHGEKHDADGEGGDEGGHGDLRGAVEDGFAELVALFEIAIDIFDLDGGVVDEDADGEGETAEGHDVDGLADQARGR